MLSNLFVGFHPTYFTLRPILKKFTEEIEEGLRSDDDIEWFITQYLKNRIITQERFAYRDKLIDEGKYTIGKYEVWD